MRFRDRSTVRLAAARRADERGDLLGRDVEVHVPDRGHAAVLDLDVLQLEHELARLLGRLLGATATGVLAGGPDVDVVGRPGQHLLDDSGGCVGVAHDGSHFRLPKPGGRRSS